MKKKKTFGLYGTNKRKTDKRADKYTEEYYEEYDDAYEEFADEFEQEDAAYEEDTDSEQEAFYQEEGGCAEEENSYYEEETYAEEDSYYEEAYSEEADFYEEDTFGTEDASLENDDDDDDEYIVEYGTSGYSEAVSYDEEDTGNTDSYYESGNDMEDDGYYEADDYAEDANSYYESAEEIEDNGEYYESEEYTDDYYYEEPGEYAEVEDDEDAFETAYGDVDDSYEEDIAVFGPVMHDDEGGFLRKLKDWVSSMTAFDAILVSTGVVLVVAVVVIFSMYLQANRINEQIEAIAPMGDELTSIGIVGEDGLLAMTNAALSGQFVVEAETEEISTLEVVDETETSKVNVSFTSVEKDLKIRFTDANTGELITGTAFEVVLTNSKGKKLVLTDDDMDGIIYAENVNPGVFDAVITSTDKYKFPTTAQQVTVKDKVEYVVINVQDEVKKESQINVAAEDTQIKDAVQEEEKITDTVEWVESSKTLVNGTESYLPVDKTTIADPAQSSRAGARMLFDGLNVTLDKSSISLAVGSSDTIKGTSYSDSTEGDETNKTEYKYTTEWKSSNEGVATVSNGTVTAKSEGTATITYTVTKKTITTKTVPGETNTTTTTEDGSLTVERYEELQEEIAAAPDSNTKYEFTEEKDDAGNVTGYTYKKTVTTTTEGESKTETSETTESASATCQVTVTAAKITSASLELSKSADSCSVGSTLTVKPSKLVYTKQDGSQETITASFPTVTWSSSDKAVATIDANGVVTGVKTGTVTITANISGIKGVDDKEVSISATTSVTISAAPVLTLTLDRTKDVYIAVGGNTTLVATVTNYKSDSGVTWESSNKKIVTVDEKGVVTGVAAGSATITATTKEKGADGNYVKATCVVTVNSNASTDTTTKLKDKNGNQIYIKDAAGNYKEAVYADYYTATEFYIRTEGQYAYTGWQTINGKTYYYDKNGKVVTGTQVIQGVTYNFDSSGAIATTVNGSTFGIDVSRHNGNIDWNAVKASGVDYVIIRCGYRGSATGALIEDENFKKNIQGAAAAGLKVGVYVFSQAINEVEAVKEASLAVSLVKGYNLSYPIFIDTESSGGRADKIDVATRTAVVNAFCQTVASAGYQPGIYASKSWYETKLNMGAIGNYKIWLAQYAQAVTYKGKYDMWQYSSKGTISGISGSVDLNLSYLGY